MKSDILFYLKLLASFLPFLLFAFLNNKANVKKENRNRQYLMPVISVIYSIVVLIFMKQLSELFTTIYFAFANLFDKINMPAIGENLRNIYNQWGVYFMLILFNT